MTTVQIPLTRGYVAIVDAADAASVLAYRWYAHPNRRTVYAARDVRQPSGKRTTLKLHQFLTGYASADHINGDGLDNRRSNLRDATTAENNRNTRRRSDNTAGYKGVSWHKGRGKWRAYIGARSSNHLGYYSTAEDAARAYDAAAREMYGEYAALNFPIPGERAA